MIGDIYFLQPYSAERLFVFFRRGGLSRNAAIYGRGNHGYAVRRLSELRNDERHRRERIAAKEVEVLELAFMKHFAEIDICIDIFVCESSANGINDGDLKYAFGVEVHSAHDFEFDVGAFLLLEVDFVLRLAAVIDSGFELKLVKGSAAKRDLHRSVFEKLCKLDFFHDFPPKILLFFIIPQIRAFVNLLLRIYRVETDFEKIIDIRHN